MTPYAQPLQKQHLCKNCGAGAVSGHLSSRPPERDADLPRHVIHVSHPKRAVQITGH